MAKAISHGHFRNGKPSKTYVSWQAMIARCNYRTHPAYDAYGGAGIKVCQRWLDSFEAFLSDMGRDLPAKRSIAFQIIRAIMSPAIADGQPYLSNRAIVKPLFCMNIKVSK